MGLFQNATRPSERELDLYSPSKRIAIEIQGPSHIPGGYRNTPAILQKDLEKVERCRCLPEPIELHLLWWRAGAADQLAQIQEAASIFSVSIEGGITESEIKKYAKSRCNTGDCYAAALMDEVLAYGAQYRHRPVKSREPELRRMFDLLTDSRGDHYVTDFRAEFDKRCYALDCSNGTG